MTKHIPEATKVSSEKSFDKLKDLAEEGHEKKNGRLNDTIAAILLSLAAIASAWCSYQSSIWDGISSRFANEAGQYEVIATEHSLEDSQKRMADAGIVTRYMEYLSSGKQEYAQFMLRTADDNLRTAIEEWLKLDPVNNSTVLHSPLLMKSYKRPYLDSAVTFREQSSKKNEDAHQADDISDRYLLLSVALAVALFFAGMSGTFRHRRLQFVSILISAVIFISVLIGIIRQPVGS